MKRYQRTIEHIFEMPVRSDIKWDDIVSLIKHLVGTSNKEAVHEYDLP